MGNFIIQRNYEIVFKSDYTPDYEKGVDWADLNYSYKCLSEKIYKYDNVLDRTDKEYEIDDIINIKGKDYKIISKLISKNSINYYVEDIIEYNKESKAIIEDKVNSLNSVKSEKIKPIGLIQKIKDILRF